MHCTVKMTEDLYWVGASDRRLALFESVYPIPRGVSYNAYVLLDEKTVLLDTVDQSVAGQFFENLAHVLGGRPLDYIVVHHMEPDHAKTLEETVRRYPEAKIICNAKIRDMIRNYFTFDIDARAILMAEGDTYCFGKHTFAYVMAPMVHWPEVMVSFDTTTGTLFSADAFGTFGALNGNLYADEYDFEHDWLPDARRYYTNIVGKYGTQVQALLKKAATLDIRMICPLHGPVWRKNIGWFVDKYSKWSSYTPEQDGSVLIAYSSVYGHTENAAQVLATMLAARGVRNIAMYDVSVTHPSYVVAEAFRCSHLVFASTTYNAGIFCNMETALLDIAAHNLQNRTIALIENGSCKSTLMKTILGLQMPISGRILTGDGLRKNEIGYLPQQTVVQKDFPASVREIVLSGCQGRCGSRPFYNREEKKLSADAMGKMQITPLAKRCYRTLSGGQQQRVLLARALCATQKMLLLDEPVSGLDPKVTAEMYALIQKLNYEDGITVVMISHDLSAALQYASHILHIGDTVFFGTKAAYLNEFPQVWQKGGVAQ